MDINHYTYRITWSEEDKEYVGLCIEYPSLSWLADSQEAALKGIRTVVKDVVSDLVDAGDPVPIALAEKSFSGKFVVRVPPDVHRHLALEAAEAGVSLNRLASSKLAH